MTLPQLVLNGALAILSPWIWRLHVKNVTICGALIFQTKTNLKFLEDNFNSWEPSTKHGVPPREREREGGLGGLDRSLASMMLRFVRWSRAVWRTLLGWTALAEQWKHVWSDFFFQSLGTKVHLWKSLSVSHFSFSGHGWTWQSTPGMNSECLFGFFTIQLLQGSAVEILTWMVYHGLSWFIYHIHTLRLKTLNPTSGQEGLQRSSDHIFLKTLILFVKTYLTSC